MAECRRAQPSQPPRSAPRNSLHFDVLFQDAAALWSSGVAGAAAAGSGAAHHLDGRLAVTDGGADPSMADAERRHQQSACVEPGRLAGPTKHQSIESTQSKPRAIAGRTCFVVTAFTRPTAIT